MLRGRYGAIKGGDYEALHELIADNAEFSVGGFEPMNGTWHGRTHAVEAVRRNFGLVKNQKPEVESIVSSRGEIAVLLREEGVLLKTGEPYSVRCARWFTFDGGKLRKFEQICAVAR